MIRTALLPVRDLLHFAALVCSSHNRLAAENLFLRKQLAFYVERMSRPRRLNNAARIALVVLAPYQLATAPRGRPTRDARAVAPAGIPTVLALEIAAPWSSPDSSVPSGLDCRHGASELHLG